MRKAQDYTVALGISAFVLLASLFGMVATPAHAGDCSFKTARVDGQIEGQPFSTPARLFGEGGDNIGLSAEDCTSDVDEARRDGRRAASIGAAMDAYGWSDGLNLTLNGANSGIGNDDTYAAGLATGYKHTFAEPLGGVIHGIAGKAGFAADTTGSDYGASVGLTLNFGSF